MGGGEAEEGKADAAGEGGGLEVAGEGDFTDEVSGEADEYGWK